MAVVQGEVKFGSVLEKDVYMGKEGPYKITLGDIDPQAAQAMADKGIKMSDYEGSAQRKFTSNYQIPVIDADGNTYTDELTFGSVVRIQYDDSKPPHPVHGQSTYIQKIRVLEVGEGSSGPQDDPEL